MATRVLTAHVPEELAETVDQYAASMDRSRGWIVKQALTGWISWERKKDALTLEAIAQVEAGQFVDDEDVGAWIDSLGTDHPLPRPRSAK